MVRCGLLGLLLTVACSAPDARPATVADASVDVAVPCAPFDVTLPAHTFGVNLAWTGSRLLDVVESTDALHPGDNVIRVIDSNGTPLSTFATISASQGTLLQRQTLVWTGVELGVLISSSSGVTLARFDASGTLVGSTPVWTQGAIQFVPSALAWAGDRYVVFALEYQLDDLWMIEVAADETPAVPIRVARSNETNALSFNHIDALETTATHYAVALETSGKTSIVTVDRSTHATGRTPLFGGNGGGLWRTKLATDGTDFVATTIDGNGLVFQRVDGAANASTPVVIAATGTDVTIVPRASGFRVYAGQSFQDYSARFQAIELDAGGAALSAPRTVLDFPALNAIGGGTALQTSDRTIFAVAHSDGGGSSFERHRLVQECEP